MIIHSDIPAIFKIQEYLPTNVSSNLSRLDKSTLDKISEIRLRKDGIVTVTVEGKNYLLSNSGIQKYSSSVCYVSSQELEDFIYKVCKGSVYAHESSINSSFITSCGIRIGLGASIDAKGQAEEITSVNIRIPHHIDGCSGDAIRYIENGGFDAGKGLLVISQPGVGKTTLLRDLAIKLSTYNRKEYTTEMQRVCVIDERYEIFMPHVFESCCIDFISGTSKLLGIERAVRLLSPQVIICDELSGADEAEKITRSKNHGVIFIASYHCDTPKHALEKDFIREMFHEGVFGAICTLKRDLKGKVLSEISVFGENNDA